MCTTTFDPNADLTIGDIQMNLGEGDRARLAYAPLDGSVQFHSSEAEKFYVIHYL